MGVGAAARVGTVSGEFSGAAIGVISAVTMGASSTSTGASETTAGVLSTTGSASAARGASGASSATTGLAVFGAGGSVRIGLFKEVGSGAGLGAAFGAAAFDPPCLRAFNASTCSGSRLLN